MPKTHTVYDDPDTDRQFEVFQSEPKSVLWMAEEDGVVLGSCGVFPVCRFCVGFASKSGNDTQKWIYPFRRQIPATTKVVGIIECDSGGTQTRDTQNRNLMLYSTELRSQE